METEESSENILSGGKEQDFVLCAQNLHKAFYHPVKVQILHGISLDIQRGEAIAIMGASGEGKSTLLHIMGTLESACAGSLKIAGQDVTISNKSRLRNRHIGFVFQAFHLLENYTVLENILMPAKIARRSTSPKSEAFQHANHLLNEVGLADRAHFHTKLLSGGEKQRVAIARALCNDPDLLLADEPSGNLDHGTSVPIHHLLLSFAKGKKRGLLVVTHDDSLAKLCDKRFLLKNGLLERLP